MVDADLAREFEDPEELFFGDPLLLDRHRILNSTSFRRLGYKTQVFLPLEADHFRTRLTHSLEVAHIAGLLAHRFGANPALAETISLAHDLGHGPFGHSSETILNKLLADVGGFEHNHQSLRVVEYLEGPYPWFRGLNLTRATRAGMEVHNTPYDRPELLDTVASLEGQLANWADRLAYNTADLEDALGANLITQDHLADLSLYRKAWDRLDSRLREKPFHAIRRIVLGHIQMILIEGLELRQANGVPLLALRDAILHDLKETEKFLLNRVYLCPQLLDTTHKVQEVISRLFARYRKEPELLPNRYLSRQTESPVDRIIGDYISGMTDRFCLKTYRQLFGEDDILLRSIQPVVGIGSL